MDDNVRKRWIDSVKRSYCGEFKITTNTHLCNVHFTPDSYNNYHLVKTDIRWRWSVGPEPTLSFPGLHPPIPPTVGATITATGIMCRLPACILPSRWQRVPASQPSALCARHQLAPSRPTDSGCHHHSHRHYVPAIACILPSRRQRVPPSRPPALCVGYRLVSSRPADSGCQHHSHRHYVPATSLHPPAPPTAGATITATGIMCPP